MGYRAWDTEHGDEAQAGIQEHGFQGIGMGHRAHFRVEQNTQPQIM